MSDKDDDQRWMDGLAGRSSSAERVTQEGVRLGAVLRARAADGSNAVTGIAQPSTSLARENRLLAHARREQLIPGRGIPRQVATWGALAASLAVVAVGVLWLRPVAPDAEVLRGVVAGVVRIETREPAAAQRKLLEDLRAVGIEGRGYQMLGRFGVDADWAAVPTEAQRALLERRALPAPPSGEPLRVEFTGQGP